MVSRFVALGDSFTEGLEDIGPDGAYRGWADLVAAHLAESNPALQYANLAVRGRKIARIRDEQVPVAIAMQPDFITIAAGGNDIMGLRCDLPALGRQFHAVLQRLVDTDAHVIAFAGFDPRRRIPLAQLPGARADRYNGAIRSSCAELGATLVDLWPMDELYKPAMWAPDRLHLSAAGHRLVATAVLASLGDVRPLAGGPAPATAQVSDLKWGAKYLAPWLLRGIQGKSSGDGLDPKRPALAPVLAAPGE